MAPLKGSLLPLILSVSICGGALIYMWYKKKNENHEHSDKSKLIRLKTNADIVPLLIGRGGATQRDVENKTGAKISFDDEAGGVMHCVIQGPSDSVDLAKSLVEGIIKENSASRTEELWVPHSACGRIIGRCGEALTELMYKCNVKIVVDPPLADVGNESQKRKFTITGLAAHIASAKTIIQDKVKEDAELRRSLDESLAKREPRGPALIVQKPEVALPQREKLKPAGVDGTMEVYVSALASPYRFWMQLLGPQAAALDNLVEKMTDYYNKEENRELHRIINPEVGQIVAAMFNVDGKWYRAQIQEIKANDYVPCQPVLDLYFVDYGDNCYAGPLEVFELRPDFLTLRFQAIECFLANVLPPKIGSADADIMSYPDESIERFEQLTHVARWKKLWSRVVSYRERDVALATPSQGSGQHDSRLVREGSPVPGVELYDNEDGRDINIGEELIRGGFALPVPSADSNGFGDLGRSKVLNSTTPTAPTTATPSAPTSTTATAAAKDIVTETKALIDDISKDAERAVREVKAEDPPKAPYQSKVKTTLEDLKKRKAEAKRLREEAAQSSDASVTPPTPTAGADFMPSFGKPLKKAPTQDAKGSANAFLKTERNGNNGV